MPSPNHLFIAVLVLLALAGCDRNTNINGEKAAIAVKQPEDAVPDESEAKEKLKTVLDSWVFGDSREKLKADHPGINFIDLAYTFDRPVLQKYDIASGRKDPKHPDAGTAFEFPVVLTLQSRAGIEIKKQHIFSVRIKDTTYCSVNLDR